MCNWCHCRLTTGHGGSLPASHAHQQFTVTCLTKDWFIVSNQLLDASNHQMLPSGTGDREAMQKDVTSLPSVDQQVSAPVSGLTLNASSSLQCFDTSSWRQKGYLFSSARFVRGIGGFTAPEGDIADPSPTEDPKNS